MVSGSGAYPSLCDGNAFVAYRRKLSGYQTRWQLNITDLFEIDRPVGGTRNTSMISAMRSGRSCMKRNARRCSRPRLSFERRLPRVFAVGRGIYRLPMHV